MLKASRLAARRKLELRVVELPAGADPADLVQQGGTEAIAAAVKQAVPFVRFRVERALASGDDSSPEGRDRMIAELRPVFETLPPSAMRMELTRLVSGRLGLSEGLAETLLASGARLGRAVAPPPRAARDGWAPPDGVGSTRGPGGERVQQTMVRARDRVLSGARTPSARFWRCASLRLNMVSPHSQRSTSTECSRAI